MNCIKCELTRARMKATALLIVGLSLEAVAARLTATYGERYYVEGGALYRVSKLPPYQPHLIWGK